MEKSAVDLLSFAAGVKGIEISLGETEHHHHDVPPGDAFEDEQSCCVGDLFSTIVLSVLTLVDSLGAT